MQTHNAQRGSIHSWTPSWIPGRIHRQRRRIFINLCLGLLLSGFSCLQSLQAQTASTELLVIEEKGCPYCAKFNREIAPSYAKTNEGKNAPLRRLDLHKTWPATLDHIERPKFTPTFILLHNNQEVGRLIGYNGDEYFWFLLGELLQNIDQPTANESRTSGSES